MQVYHRRSFATVGFWSHLRAGSFGIFRNKNYSGIYSGYSAPRSRIAGMVIQVFRIIPLLLLALFQLFLFRIDPKRTRPKLSDINTSNYHLKSINLTSLSKKNFLGNGLGAGDNTIISWRSKSTSFLKRQKQFTETVQGL